MTKVNTFMFMGYFTWNVIISLPCVLKIYINFQGSPMNEECLFMELPYKLNLLVLTQQPLWRFSHLEHTCQFTLGT